MNTATAARTDYTLKAYNHLENLGARFIDELDKSEKTVNTYRRALRQFFAYLNERNIKDPERADIVDYRNALKTAGKQPTTIQNYITVVRLFFDWALTNNEIETDPARKIRGAKISHNFKKDIPTDSQVEDLLDTCGSDSLQDKRDCIIIRLMVENGLRDIELSRANVEDIRPLNSETVLYLQRKGMEEKTAFAILDEDLEKEIREYLKARGARPAEPLFTSLSNNSKSNRLTTRSISRIVKTRLREIGIDSPRITAHSLRHKAITTALEGGATLQQTQQFAGHANMNTTLIYSHNLEAAKNPCSKLNASRYKRRAAKA